jgi:hypothetical protein
MFTVYTVTQQLLYSALQMRYFCSIIKFGTHFPAVNGRLVVNRAFYWGIRHAEARKPAAVASAYHV